MKESEKITDQDIEKAKVTLKPIFGIRPRIYIPILFAVLIFIILFFLLVNPGLVNPGAKISFEGNPDVAALYAENTYIGNTSDGIRLRPGSYQIEIRKRGFEPKAIAVKVPNRIFATLILPPRVTIQYELKSESLESILIPSFKEFASWSLSGRPSAIYQLPMVLSEASKDLAAFPVADTVPIAEPLLAAGLSIAQNTSSIRDLIYASFSLGAPGASPLGFISMARSAIALLANSKSYVGAFSEIAPERTDDAIRNALSALEKETSLFETSLYNPVGVQIIGSHSFIIFNEGYLKGLTSTPGGTGIPYIALVPKFGLASTEVTQRQYARFLKENPEWAPENRATLIEKGLVDNYYLADIDISSPSDKPITGVSWYAATAYCEWLCGYAPDGYEVRLPTEAMWEMAASQAYRNIKNLGVFNNRSSNGPLSVASYGRDASGFSDLFGNVWEWTSDSFRPYVWITEDSPAFKMLANAGNSKTVKGGSWANSADQISIESRGPMPADHSSEFLGFRPALIRK